jgi:hypothetical protein
MSGLGKFGPVELKEKKEVAQADRSESATKQWVVKSSSQQPQGNRMEAMFERGLNRGNGAARVKCAAKTELMTARELASQTNF